MLALRAGRLSGMLQLRSRKTTAKMIRTDFLRIAFWLAPLLLATACHDGPFDDTVPPAEVPPLTATIAAVRQQVGSASLQVTGDWTVSGIVTTTDRAFGFYHALCIESEGAAIELMAAVDRLHVDYPPGCRVTLRLQGLTLGPYRGMLQAGTAPEVGSYYPTGYLASPAAVAAHLFRTDDPRQEPQPALRRIGELTLSACGTLVRIDGLQLIVGETADSPAASVRWGGTHAFADDAGNRIYSFVRSGANFAEEPVPEGRCSLTGILQYESGHYLIQLRDATDCQP